MKFSDEYREQELAQKLSKEIKDICTRNWTIMEVCGGQTHTILQYGLEDLLPPEVRLVHGPGCPVCVTPIEMIDRAIAIASLENVIFCSYGDMLRVPGTTIDLLEVKARGGDVRTVYSPLDALSLAKRHPERKVVFFAVGFETTAPANAAALWQAKRLGHHNFYVLCSHVTVPPVMAAMLESPDNTVQAFLGPGHVCTVMGTSEYEKLCEKYHIPIIVSGFEPIDILDGILRSIKQLEGGQAKVENAYARAVVADGNRHAMDIMAEVFRISDRDWRGLGSIPLSGLRISDAYRDFDAELQFDVSVMRATEQSVCISGEILKGLKKPPECPAFGTSCTPSTPLGATMVSSEGTCANYYKFNRHKQVTQANAN
jgi:hydrogenase expression/formation protein HypD